MSRQKISRDLEWQRYEGLNGPLLPLLSSQAYGE